MGERPDSGVRSPRTAVANRERLMVETALFRRYVKACDLQQPCQPDRVTEALTAFFDGLGVKVTVREITTFKEANQSARAAGAAWATGAAWAARDARAAWAARATGAAWAAGAAWDAGAAWATGAAGAAGD